LGVPARRHRAQPAANRWGTIRYAIEDNARTARLCAILFMTGVASVPLCLILVLLHLWGFVI